MGGCDYIYTPVTTGRCGCGAVRQNKSEGRLAGHRILQTPQIWTGDDSIPLAQTEALTPNEQAARAAAECQTLGNLRLSFFFLPRIFFARKAVDVSGHTKLFTSAISLRFLSS